MKTELRKKRFVILVGSKGGLGKSFMARLILDLIRRLGIIHVAYDADPENPDLYRYYNSSENSVEQVNFFGVADSTKVLEKMYKDTPDVVLLDLPASSGNGMRDIFTKFGLLETAVELGYRITLVFVINTDNPVIASVDAMYNFSTDKVDYVIAKNLCWSKETAFEMWNNSKIRKTLIDDCKAIEIEIPALDDTAFLALSKAKTPFSAATKEVVGFGSSLLVRGFMMTSQAELDKAGEYLGLVKNVKQ